MKIIPYLKDYIKANERLSLHRQVSTGIARKAFMLNISKSFNFQMHVKNECVSELWQEIKRGFINE